MEIEEEEKIRACKAWRDDEVMVQLSRLLKASAVLLNLFCSDENSPIDRTGVSLRKAQPDITMLMLRGQGAPAPCKDVS